MTKDSKKMLVDESLAVKTAMELMNEAGIRVLFLVREGRLVASLTDGDVRRWILTNGNLNAPVKNAANYSPMYLGRVSRKSAVWFMRDNGIEAVPIVDETMQVIDVEVWHEASWQNGLKAIDLPVIMMAGGRGSRLYPYTKVLPKPLIPIGEIPISEHIINQFYRQGCKQFYLVVNHKRNMIKAYYNDIEKPYKIHFVDEDVPLGTGGGLSLLKGTFQEMCILTNCDIMIREDFSKIVEHHKDNGNIITMICAARNFRIPYGVVRFREGGEIESMEEKPDISFFTNTGCYIIEPDVIENMKDNTEVGFPDVIKHYKESGARVGVYPISENAWLDMGQMDEMERMRRQIGIEDE